MIFLTESIAMTADERQYIIGRPRRRPGKDDIDGIVIDNPRYFLTLSSALKSCVAMAVREKVADGTLTTLKGVVEEQRRIQNDFAKMVESLEGEEMVNY